MYEDTDRDVRNDLRGAGFNKELIVANVSGLRKVVSKLDWNPGTSTWANYVDECGHYSDQDREQKLGFVRKAVATRHWELVWDLGCNTVVFSRVAAKNAHYVVAQDTDHLAVERLVGELKSEGRRERLASGTRTLYHATPRRRPS